MKIKKFWKPAVLLAVIIFLSLYPSSKLPKVPLFPHVDKVIHICMYFVLTLFLVRPFQTTGARFPYFYSVLTCAIVGGMLEICQAVFTTSRSGSWLDEVANISGAILGALLFYTYTKRIK